MGRGAVARSGHRGRAIAPPPTNSTTSIALISLAALCSVLSLGLSGRWWGYPLAASLVFWWAWELRDYRARRRRRSTAVAVHPEGPEAQHGTAGSVADPGDLDRVAAEGSFVRLETVGGYEPRENPVIVSDLVVAVWAVHERRSRRRITYAAEAEPLAWLTCGVGRDAVVATRVRGEKTVRRLPFAAGFEYRRSRAVVTGSDVVLRIWGRDRANAVRVTVRYRGAAEPGDEAPVPRRDPRQTSRPQTFPRPGRA